MRSSLVFGAVGMGAALAVVIVAACSSDGTSTGDNVDLTPDGAGPSPSTPPPDGDGGTDVDAGYDPWAWEGPLPDGPPVETRPPNAESQQPAFPGQTRAPGHPTNVVFDVRVRASGLQNPWAIAPLPDGTLLVTERAGRLRIVNDGGVLSDPLSGVPTVVSSGQGGLLDVVLDPAFAQNDRIYFTYAESRDDGSGTAVARARLVRGATPSLADVETIWRMEAGSSSGAHFGSRIAFARDGNLFVTIGERGVAGGAGNAQDLTTAAGKVIRIRPDGTIPTDNPFVGRADALPEIWTSGYRNPQSAAVHPGTGALWTVEHGAQGGDEINVARAGKDYGWPTVAYGEQYGGAPIGEGLTARADVEQPIYYWDPVIAPSGAAFYDAPVFPAWRRSFFVGGLGGQHLARLTLDGERIIGEERLLESRGRIRDVRVSPSGTLLVSDESAGEILELVPSP